MRRRISPRELTLDLNVVKRDAKVSGIGRDRGMGARSIGKVGEVKEKPLTGNLAVEIFSRQRDNGQMGG